MLEAVNISHSFDYLLFKDVNLSIFPQTSIAITGESGSGKTTLLHILSTLLKPRKGRVFLFQKDIYSLKENERILIRREKIGIIFQFHYLFKGFSAIENIQIASILSRKEMDFSIAQRLGIKKILHKKIADLSGGEQQRVSIARVLAKQPKIIFADEPTGNLDSKNAHEIISILIEYIRIQKGILILVTHNEKIAKMCNKHYVISNQLLIEKN
jgi:putative ABC transport system ATP-binding protein